MQLATCPKLKNALKRIGMGHSYILRLTISTTSGASTIALWTYADFVCVQYFYTGNVIRSPLLAILL